MRLPREIVSIRESFVRDLFRKDKKLTGAAARDIVKAHFGKTMSPNRVYALKAEVAAETGEPTVNEEVPVEMPVVEAPVVDTTPAVLTVETPPVTKTNVSNTPEPTPAVPFDPYALTTTATDLAAELTKVESQVNE